MQVNKLHLKDFRSYRLKSFNFVEGVNVIIGQNGVGKTNILEALYILSHGKSFRSRFDIELINFNADVLNINAQFSNSDDFNLFVGVERGFKNRSKKLFKVNDTNKSLNYFTQIAKSVIFSPTDLDIILGSPSIRRNFLNEILNQIDYRYKKKVSDLKKVVTSRNKLLGLINEGLANYNQIEYYNDQLVELSSYIHNSRKALIKFLNIYLNDNYTKFANFNGEVKVKYLHSVANSKRILQYKQAEIASKRTLIGAQKDDFCVLFNKQGQLADSKYFSSRGEARTIVFILKLGCLEYMQQKLNSNLILLLDDIYSELDFKHRKAISSYFKDNQVIITTATKSLIPKQILKKCNNLIHLSE